MSNSYLPEKETTIRNLLSISGFPPHITAVFIQNASKIFSKIVANSVNNSRDFLSLCTQIEEYLYPYLKNQNLEIQERATSLSQIISIYKTLNSDALTKRNQILMDDSIKENEDAENNEEPNENRINFESFFYAYPLNPVAAKAQKKVPVPVGLELDIPFDDDDSDDEYDERNEGYEKVIQLVDEDVQEDESSELDEEEQKTRENVAQSRRFEQENNPNYLKSKNSKTPLNKKSKPKNEVIDFLNNQEDKVEEAVEVASEVASNSKAPAIPGLISSEQFLLKSSAKKSKSSKVVKQTKVSKKKKTKEISIENEEDEDDDVPKFTIRALEMPEGADLNDNDDDESTFDILDPHRALASVVLEDESANKHNNMTKKKSVKESNKTTKERNKSTKKVAKTSVVNNLITGAELIVETNMNKPKKRPETSIGKTKTSKIKTQQKENKPHGKNDVTGDKENEKKIGKKVKKPKTKMNKDSKNRAEYEETLGNEPLVSVKVS